MELEEKQGAVIRKIEIIGEAVKNVSDAIKEKYPEIPWIKIAGTRDKLIHGYFGVNIERIWFIVEKDLPELKRQIQKILNEEQAEKTP